jgi:hypothetical protein
MFSPPFEVKFESSYSIVNIVTIVIVVAVFYYLPYPHLTIEGFKLYNLGHTLYVPFYNSQSFLVS